jgi:hypothetical protein
MLCSHFELLSMVKGQITPEADGFRAVSSMVNKTVQAMNQLKVARKQMVSGRYVLTSLFVRPITDNYLDGQ